LARHPEVEARLEEIRAEAEATLVPVGTAAIAARAKVTADSLIDEAEAVRAEAMKSRQLAAANTAIKQKGVLGGVWIEKSEVGSPGEFDHLGDEELDRMLLERFLELYGSRLAISNGTVTLNGRALASPGDDHD
jgi:hypothetical protein